MKLEDFRTYGGWYHDVASALYCTMLHRLYYIFAQLCLTEEVGRYSFFCGRGGGGGGLESEWGYDRNLELRAQEFMESLEYFGVSFYCVYTFPVLGFGHLDKIPDTGDRLNMKTFSRRVPFISSSILFFYDVGPLS